MTAGAVTVRFETVARNTLGDGPAQDYPYEFLPNYLDLLNRRPNTEALYAVSQDGTIRLPMVVRTSRFFRRGQLLSPPLKQGANLSPADEVAFLEGMLTAMRWGRVCHRLIQPTTNCVFQTAPRGARSCPFGSYRLTIGGRSDDELLEGMHSDHRHKIRAALRRGAEVRLGREQLQPFFELHATTMRRSSMGHDRWEFIEALYGTLSAVDSIVCAVVYGKTGDPLGGILIPYTRHSGSYVYGGTAEHVDPSGAIKLLHWEVLRWLRGRGVRSYDFVGARLSDVSGTKLSSIQRFKSRFGSALWVGCLWKVDVVPVAARLFDTAAKIRSMLRHKRPNCCGEDIIEQEQGKVSAPVLHAE